MSCGICHAEGAHRLGRSVNVCEACRTQYLLLRDQLETPDQRDFRIWGMVPEREALTSEERAIRQLERDDERFSMFTRLR